MTWFCRSADAFWACWVRRSRHRSRFPVRRPSNRRRIDPRHRFQRVAPQRLESRRPLAGDAGGDAIGLVGSFSSFGTAAPEILAIHAPEAGTYRAGSTLFFSVTFDDHVVVVGQPTLPLRVGTSQRHAVYVGGRGITQVFATRIVPGDADSDGIEILGGPQCGPADSIRNSAGTDAVLAPPDRWPLTAGIRVDAKGPTLLMVDPPLLASADRAVSVTAVFSEPVQLHGRPFMTLFVGGQERRAFVTAVRGAAVTFTYRAGMRESLAMVFPGPITVPQGSGIGDGVGNAARLQDAGDLPFPYVTLQAQDGPRHALGGELYLGNRKPDGDPDGQPTAAALGDDGAEADDEDAIDPALVRCVPGQPLGVTVQATNLTGWPAQLRGFIDWNADGDFSDAGEACTVAVPNGSHHAAFSLPVTVPLGVSTTAPIALRLRLSSRSSRTAPATGPTGAARDGEVEDYLLESAVVALDYGDLGGSYATSLADDGARHAVIDKLRLGGGVDEEFDGVPSSQADGDDAAGVGDDEDGFTPTSVLPVPGASLSYVVSATNGTGVGAVLYGFTDWNDDGDFDDVGERSSVDVAAVGFVKASLPWTVPLTAVVNQNVAVRLRLVGRNPTGAPESSLGPDGYASSGEVEDYELYVSDGTRDYGDLPDAVLGTTDGVLGTSGPPDYRTRQSDNGPSHGIRPGLFLGAAKAGGGADLDGETDGQPSASGSGDDTGDIDDETGLKVVDFSGVYSVETGSLGEKIPVRDISLEFEMPVTNLTGAMADVWAGVDIDGDGTFESVDQYGAGIVPIPGDGSQQKVGFALTYIVGGAFGTPAAFTRQMAVRVRLSTDPAVSSCQGVGPLVDGEVHDEVITLDFPAYTGTDYLYDFGDLPDGPYPTAIVNGGAWHSVVPNLCIGAKVDVEVDGVPTPHALGDDVAGSDDEDGFDPAAVEVVPGQATSFTVKVTTPIGTGATLYGFTDWNNDGDFKDAGETTSLDVAAGLANKPMQLPFDVPAQAHVGEKLAVRLRLVGRSAAGAPQSAPLGPGGYAPSGEVEDYFIYIPDGKLDFGDLPDAADIAPWPWGPTIDTASYTTADLGDYWTLLAYDSAQQGPIEPGFAARHRIRPDLYIAAPGSSSPIDAETDGQPNATATGDDINGDDEDGVTFSGISGHVVDNVTATSADAAVDVTAAVSVKNETGSAAWCSGVFFLDKDAPIALPVGIDGALPVPSQPGFATMQMNFSHLLHLAKPVSSMNLAGVFRFRVSTQGDLNNLHFPRWWLHRDGEVEDYVVDLPLDFGEWWKGTYLDYGDLFDGKYPTRLAQDGARHQFTLGQQEIFLGALPPDGDKDGKPSANADGDDTAGVDDEDGFDPGAAQLTAGAAGSFAVTVTSAAAATLYGFADWNDDGLFTGLGETATVAVPAGSTAATVNLSWNVPAAVVTGKNLAVRLRLSTAAGLGATGFAADGEVEDYVVTVRPRYDYGDLPDGPYATMLAHDGARHTVVPGLRLGELVDDEVDGAAGSQAGGDDTAGVDDEDGFDPAAVTVVPGSATVFSVRVTTPPGQRATLYGFVDWNRDGDFGDVGEQSSIDVGAGLSNAAVSLPWSVPVATVVGQPLAVRLRLSTATGLGSAGLAPDGEVEDYPLTVPQQYDFGDLPDAVSGTLPGTDALSGTVTLGDYRTRLADDGPRHVIRSDLAIRSSVDPATDAEPDGIPNASAKGDDNTQTADERSVSLIITNPSATQLTASTMRLSVTLQATVPVDNRTGQRAFLSGFVDTNNDGDFSDAGESAQLEVPSVTGNPSYQLTFQAAWIIDRQASTWTIRLPVRLRLSTQEGLGPDGPAADGEVEDHVVTMVLDVASWWNRQTQ